jgi:hypothetical protein
MKNYMKLLKQAKEGIIPLLFQWPAEAYTEMLY